MIFLVTGVSTGLGRGIAQAVLDAGHTVVGTLRKPEQVAAFEALAPGRAHAVLLDVTDFDRIPGVVAGVEETIGPIDVLVNNAGTGVEGPLEETSMKDIKDLFEVNVFGQVAVTQAVLPYLRRRRAGHIIFISSLAGLIGQPTLPAYVATKFALEGFSDSLRLEVNRFGIRVTAVEPGWFRTEWAGAGLNRVPRSIPDYDELIDPVRKQVIEEIHGRQAGDPYKAGLALIAIAESDAPPAHLPLGTDSVAALTGRRRQFDEEFQAWMFLSTSTDFDGGGSSNLADA